jgi:hypothetical protein
MIIIIIIIIMIMIIIIMMILIMIVIIIIIKIILIIVVIVIIVRKYSNNNTNDNNNNCYNRVNNNKNDSNNNDNIYNYNYSYTNNKYKTRIFGVVIHVMGYLQAYTPGPFGRTCILIFSWKYWHISPLPSWQGRPGCARSCGQATRSGCRSGRPASTLAWLRAGRWRSLQDCQQQTWLCRETSSTLHR